MKRLAVGLLTVVALVTVITLLLGTLSNTHLLESDTDRAYRAALQSLAVDRAQLEYERAQLDAARAQAQADALLPWVTGIEIALLLLVPVLAAAGVSVLLDAYGQRRRPVYRIGTGEGAAAFPRWYLEQAPDAGMLALEGWHAANVTRAGVALPPAHYAPHVVYQNRQEGGELPGPDELPALAPFTVPTFGAAIEAGLFRSGRYLLGYGLDGAPIQLDADRGRSLLIAGQGGAGGSTALTCAALQELLIPPHLVGLREPPRFIIVDSHAHKPESLTHRLDGLGDRVMLAARAPGEVARALATFNRVCQQRLDHPAPPGGYAYSLVLLVDEASDLFEQDSDYHDLIPELAATLSRANNQYRGVGGRAVARFHALPAQALGNRAGVRRSFRSRVLLQGDPQEGVLAGLPPAVARQLLALGIGECVVSGPDITPARALLPNVAPGDVDRALSAAGLSGRPSRRIYTMPPQRATAPDGVPDGVPDGDPPPFLQPGPVAPGDVVITSSGTPSQAPTTLPAPTDEQRQIVALFADGQTVAQIVKALWPDLSGRGATMNEYQQRTNQVNRTIQRYYRAPGQGAG
jgi:hypothetical protein